MDRKRSPAEANDSDIKESNECSEGGLEAEPDDFVRYESAREVSGMDRKRSPNECVEANDAQEEHDDFDSDWVEEEPDSMRFASATDRKYASAKEFAEARDCYSEENDAELGSLRYEAALSVLEESDKCDGKGESYCSEQCLAVPQPPQSPRRPGLVRPQNVALSPALRVTKGAAAQPLAETLSMRHRPGAFQMQGRAFGAIPMWARIRQASRIFRSSRSARLVSDVDTCDHNESPQSAAGNEANVGTGASPSEDLAPQRIPHDEDFDPKNERKFHIFCWSTVMILLVLGAIAAGVGVAVSLRHSMSGRDHKGTKCDFTGQSQPDIFQQCICFKSVKIISPQVANSYNNLLKNDAIQLPDYYAEPINSCTPVNLALLWLAEEASMGAEGPDRLRLLNRFVLTVLFITWGGPSWKRHNGWLTTEDECTWFGVLCRNQEITGLSLANNSFAPRSTIPTELFLLTGLESLFLANNEIIGNISSSISRLKNLEYICVAGNKLEGNFPFTDIASLTNLRSMIISENHFVGTMPSTIGQLKALEDFSAPNNFISGSVPSELAFATSLVMLDFRQNFLTGYLPTELGRLSKLEFLNLAGNLGRMPTEICELTSLRYLQLSGCGLHGKIPTEIGALSNLVWLQLDRNSLTGSIPSSLAKCLSLNIIDLYDNKLAGTIPSELGLIPGLERLDASENQLTGSIPRNIFRNSKLETLFLANNSLTGSLFGYVQNASNLVCIDIRSNRLTGSVGESFCNITEVAVDCSGPFGINEGCTCCSCGGEDVCTTVRLLQTTTPSTSVLTRCE